MCIGKYGKDSSDDFDVSAPFSRPPDELRK